MLHYDIKREFIFRAKHGEFEAMQNLLDMGCDINCIVDGNNAIYSACENEKSHVVQWLIERGADINLPGLIDSPLSVSINNQNNRLVQYLLDCGIDVNQSYKNFYTPLIMSLHMNNMKVFDILVKAGADINIMSALKTDTNGRTPLFIAAGVNVHATKVLLSMGARIEVDGKGHTPLMHAAIKNKHTCINVLIKAGSDPNQVNQHGNTALHLACLSSNEKSVEMLLKVTDLSIVNKKGQSPLDGAKSRYWQDKSVVPMIEAAMLQFSSKEVDASSEAPSPRKRMRI